MKRALTCIAAALSLLAAVLTPTPAWASQNNELYFFGNLCNGQQCLNDTLGGKYQGSPVQWWSWGSVGEPNNDWNVWDAGTVECTANSFPFYSRSEPLLTTCLAHWKGLVVFKIAFAPGGKGSGYCIDPSATEAHFRASNPAELAPCEPAYSQGLEQYFIYATDIRLVSVFATAVSYALTDDHTYWLGTCPNGNTQNAERVCVTSLAPKTFQTVGRA